MIKIIKLFEFGASLHFRNMVLGTKQSSTLSGKSTDTIDWQVNRKRKIIYYGKKNMHRIESWCPFERKCAETKK
jgi:hypothetical protein